MRVALATTSTLAAEAGAEIARAGGNAVDSALAAAFLSTNTEPGVCALAGGGYVSVWAPDAAPVTIDGNVAVPGTDGAITAAEGRVQEVSMDYGGGITTLTGAGSVAVPGTLAALDKAWQLFGSLSWGELLQPTIRAVTEGFPLSSACHYYLRYSGTSIFGVNDDSRKALHHADGSLKAAGESIHVPHLAASLEGIAEHGAAEFYSGTLARRLVDSVGERGGSLTATDMANYAAVVRDSLQIPLADWTIATNPPPAIGGAMLGAMLMELGRVPVRKWTPESTTHLLNVYRAVLGFRRDCLDLSRDLGTDVARLLQRVTKSSLLQSGSTVHTSATDENGLACAVTASSGYGSGEMPAGTGLWLNNCLGEIDLNRHGLSAGPPGERLLSNMAPTTARRGASALAIGSPGASRITTALCQTFVNFVHQGMSLSDAVNHPRLHLEFTGETEKIAYESGMPVAEPRGAQCFDEPNMYFGGVGAVLYDTSNGFSVAADPRRVGGIYRPD